MPARLGSRYQHRVHETRRDETSYYYSIIYHITLSISTMTVEYYLVLNAELQQSALKICKVSAPLGRTPMCAFE